MLPNKQCKFSPMLLNWLPWAYLFSFLLSYLVQFCICFISSAYFGKMLKKVGKLFFSLSLSLSPFLSLSLSLSLRNHVFNKLISLTENLVYFVYWPDRSLEFIYKQVSAKSFIHDSEIFTRLFQGQRVVGAQLEERRPLLTASGPGFKSSSIGIFTYIKRLLSNW